MMRLFQTGGYQSHVIMIGRRADWVELLLSGL